jgi:hypothetical protein
MRKVISYFVAGASIVVIFPVLCFAQFGAIAGVVRDESGAVLPGVTVEASSPALIEKTRTAISDSAGQYNVEQLRPGVYTVTFSLTGFNSVRREGIEISAGFTAPVNASLKVGAVQETITVSGQSPVVDVQNISQQKTLVKEVLDALPTARSFATLGATLPSVIPNQRDVGGSLGERGNVLSVHGANAFDMTIQLDGIPLGGINAGGGGSAYGTFSLNDAAAQEISFETGAISIESASGGVRVNVIPRQGGNAFSGSLFGNFATREMSRSNFTADLQARGAKAPAGFDRLWDESATFGGPIRRDRLWFFYAHRYRGNALIGTDSFYAKDPLAVVYNPDTSRPLQGGGWDMDNQLRLTAQLTQRNKVSAVYDRANKCNCPVTDPLPTITPEASNRLIYPRIYMASVSWQSTISSKLLWDSAVSYNRQDWANEPLTIDSITATEPVSVLEATTGRRLRAPATRGFTHNGQSHLRGVLSYVTGSHAAKVGITWHTGTRDIDTSPLSDSWSYTVFNAVPQSVTLTAAPYQTLYRLNADMGVFAQDKWTLRRLTMTGAIRFDYLNSEVPPQSAPAGRWIGARSFDAINDVPNWKDISPRLGVSYDLFGNGKTAIKATFSRYVSQQVFGFPDSINPFGAGVNSATRTWNDFNQDFIPRGDPLNPLPNGEFLGTINPAFGKSIITTRYDPAVSQGWGKRPYNWEYSASVQHELLPRVSMEVGYYRRTFGNFTVTDNLDVTPADFDQFCFTAPTDLRLGDVSGSQVCGIYDISREKAGIANNQIIRFASNYPGEISQTYDGFDLSMNARPGRGLFLQAGLNVGRTVLTNCALVDDPTALRFCEVNPGFKGAYRVSGAYTFPWNLQVSGVFQSSPADPFTTIAGPPRPWGQVNPLANYQVRNADAAASLGRPIATPGGVITVPLIDPSSYTDFYERVNQVDLRLTKGMRIGRYRLEAMVDYYNLLNSSTVLGFVTTYGPSWYQPSTVLQSGFLKLGGRLTF